MADNSLIEWTDTTWQPITGCSVVSPGCTNCYAMKLAGGRLRHHPSRAGLTIDSKAGPVWNGQVRLNEEWLEQPLRWSRPRRIFVCAHGDLFHESVPDEWIDQVFAIMALAPQHTFQVLTKRADRMRAYLGEPGEESTRTRYRAITEAIERRGEAMPANFWFMQHIWLGFSAEDQARFDERWNNFRHIGSFGPKWASLEPLLGPIDLGVREDWCDLCGGTGKLARWPKGTCHVCAGRGRVWIVGEPLRSHYPRLSWIVVGGESGPDARPMHPDWARKVRDDCAAAGIAFFFKQWGEWAEWAPPPYDEPEAEQVQVDSEEAEAAWASAIAPCLLTHDGRRFDHPDALPDDTPARLLQRIGKKAAGRILDGSTYSHFPERRT